MALPIMTPEQRTDALARATEVRQARSVLLAQVKSGELTPGQVFERTDDEIVRKTRVLRVLRALPGYGPAKVAALMTASGVDEKRRVGGLTGAQRAKLLEAVSPARADGRAPDESSARTESAPVGRDLRQALQEQIGQTMQPVLDELQHRLADAVRQQIERGLLLPRGEIEGEADGASQPPPRHLQDPVERASPQLRFEGRPGDAGAQADATEQSAGDQDDTRPQPPGMLGGVGTALQVTSTRLASTLRGLLQTVRSLLQTAVSWLSRILAALRRGLVTAVHRLGQGIGAFVRKVVVALLGLILVALRDHLGSVIGKVVRAAIS
jgi:ribosomal protein S13